MNEVIHCCVEFTLELSPEVDASRDLTTTFKENINCSPEGVFPTIESLKDVAMNRLLPMGLHTLEMRGDIGSAKFSIGSSLMVDISEQDDFEETEIRVSSLPVFWNQELEERKRILTVAMGRALDRFLGLLEAAEQPQEDEAE